MSQQTEINDEEFRWGLLRIKPTTPRSTAFDRTPKQCASDPDKYRLPWLNSRINDSAKKVGNCMLQTIPLEVQQFAHAFHSMLIGMTTDPEIKDDKFSFTFQISNPCHPKIDPHMHSENAYRMQLSDQDIAITGVEDISMLKYYTELVEDYFPELKVSVESNKITIILNKELKFFLCVVSKQ